MSDLRIALVAEGPLDKVVIEAALTVILGENPFILTLLQPEQTQPQLGNGWGGVLKWCHATSLRYQGSLDADPMLTEFDLIIIHLDVDVAGFDYGNCGAEIAAMVQQFNWLSLPCQMPCPPVNNTVDALTNVLRSWLRDAVPGQRSVLCLPAQSSGTWLAAAALPAGNGLLQNAECNTGLESRLSGLPLAQRIRKNRRDYIAKSPLLQNNWRQVTMLCSQAQRFEDDILAALHRLGRI